MSYRIHSNYFESEVLSADPVRLVSILYRAAIDAVGMARQHLAAGEIRERSRKVSKALSIVYELTRTLDHEHGGEIARSLAGLYAYISKRLVEANTKQADAPLAEVERLLLTLLEAWSAVPETSHESEPAAEEHYQSVSCAY
jgi:flagellar secretion chaperone FliS